MSNARNSSSQQDAIARAVQEALEAQQARMAELEQALEAEKAKHARAPREKKPTVKQQRFLDAMRQDPDAGLYEWVRAAGAGGKTEPHGFLWRLVADGYIEIRLPEESAAESAEVLQEGGNTEDPAEVEAEVRQAMEQEPAA